MTKNKLLEEIAKHHSSYVSKVKALGEHQFPEDIVQEMYLKIHKYSKPEQFLDLDGNWKVKKLQGYVFFTIKSILYDYREAKNKVRKVNIDEVSYKLTDEPSFYKEAFEILYEKLDEEVNSWHWYDRDLFNLYKSEYKRALSMRKIAKETKISWVSIFNTLKKCKDKVRETLREDYDDLQNGDYELIKK